MRSRLAIGFAVACTLLLGLVAGPATGQDSPSERKAVLDARIDKLQEKIDAAKQQEGVLSSQIEAVSSKIAALQDDVDRASSKLDGLESVLALHQRKLDRLNQLFRLQTRKLVFLQKQHKAATDRLNKRIVEIYTSDTTEPLTVVLEAGSFSDLIDQLEFLNDIGRQDEEVANEVRVAKVQMRVTREATKKTRNEVAETTRVVAERTAEQRAVRDRLTWSQRQLATARREKRETLAGVVETKAEAEEHKEELEAESAALTAKLQAVQSGGSVVTGTGAPSSAGFVWPVHGVVTSGFGWRWGRMHEGVDIAVGSGTPVVSAAGGTVVVAGWMGGYGNLVVVDHGNGLATAYGHQSSIAAGNGSSVGQGQTIGYVGCTGHCFGPHLHFEVRINGSPVDPMRYL